MTINKCEHHPNKMKEENNIIISLDAEEAFDKFKQCFIRKTLNKLDICKTCTSTSQRLYMISPKLTSYSMIKR